MLEHMGMRWGYVFLRSASNVGPEQVKDLMIQAVEMYLSGEGERTIKRPGFEGTLHTDERYELIGAIGGQRFDAELETPYGRDTAAFLVSEQTQGLGSVISKN
jgi:hypothetical protein